MQPRVSRHVVRQPQDKSIRLIALPQGKNAVVDAADYEPLSQWNWYVDRNKGNFYAMRAFTLNGKLIRYSMQRQLLGLEYGDPRIGDHIDGNTLNYRRSNLRIVSPLQNKLNQKTYRNNLCGLAGACYRKNRGHWVATIKLDGKAKYLGSFNSAEEASNAYHAAADKHFGEFHRERPIGELIEFFAPRPPSECPF